MNGAVSLCLVTPFLLDATVLSEEMLERMAAALPPIRREAAARRRGMARREAVAAAYLAFFVLLPPWETGKEPSYSPCSALLPVCTPSWPSLEELLRVEKDIARLAERIDWPVGEYGQPFPNGVSFSGGCAPSGPENGGMGSDEPACSPVRRFVSLSHSEGVAAAVSCPVPVGLDLQGAVSGETAQLRQIAAKFHPDERARLAGLPDSQFPAAFRRLWAAKESVLKLCGRGLSQPLSSFCIREDGSGELDGKAFLTANGETQAGALSVAVWR